MGKRPIGLQAVDLGDDPPLDDDFIPLLEVLDHLLPGLLFALLRAKEHEVENCQEGEQQGQHLLDAATSGLEEERRETHAVDSRGMVETTVVDGPMEAAGMSGAKQRILVAMSGGVDSSVVAARLLEAGHEVLGVFMRNGQKPGAARASRQGCCSVDDAQDARRVADRLGIPFYALDLSEPFDQLIAEFTQAYLLGRTPNPCIECNRRFKMGVLLRAADDFGATYVATGHYARIVDRHGRLSVARGLDRAKDQSYVLFSLDQAALSRTRFPLGEMTKQQVRNEARRFRLPVAEKPESMEICFVPTGDYRDVLRERASGSLRPGPILDPSGIEIGRHEGTALFTIGQRRGLPSGQPHPLYVTRIEPETGAVHVGPRTSLMAAGLEASAAIWSGRVPEVSQQFSATVQIRSHHRPVPAVVEVIEPTQFRVRFEDPQDAVTPGQAAVVYDGDSIVVGGWIHRSLPCPVTEGLTV